MLHLDKIQSYLTLRNFSTFVLVLFLHPLHPIGDSCQREYGKNGSLGDVLFCVSHPDCLCDQNFGLALLFFLKNYWSSLFMCYSFRGLLCLAL